MSNYLAVATVTATLRQMLQITLDPRMGSVQVTTKNPTDSTLEQVQTPTANIFLYQVTPNAALRNNDLPTRNNNGQLAARPQVALDLHYLFSFYGDAQKLAPERLLGSVVETFHTQPIVDPSLIRETVSHAEFLGGSNLADQIERVRLTPTYLSLEELSKVWSVFLQKPYTLSVTYRAEVILIDADTSPAPALPVRGRSLTSALYRPIYIDSVEALAGPNAPIFHDSNLRINGRNLAAEHTRVSIGSQIVEPIRVSDTEITLALPPKLPPGLQNVQVLHQQSTDGSANLRPGAASNTAPFLLRPQLAYDHPEIGNGEIHFGVVPPCRPDQKVLLHMNQMQTGANPPARFTLSALPAPIDSTSANADTLKKESHYFAHLGKIPQGDYLIRIQVDDAESLLETDPDGRYNRPCVKIYAITQ